MTVDTSDRICVYYLKDQHRICKLNLENNFTNFGIQSLYSPLIASNKPSIIFIGHKETELKQSSVIELIKYQKLIRKGVLSEFEGKSMLNYASDCDCRNYFEGGNMTADAFKSKTNFEFLKSEHSLGRQTGTSLIFSVKIKDILLRCYPDLRIPFKNKVPLKKIFENHTLRELHSFDLGKLNILNIKETQTPRVKFMDRR